MLKYKWEKAKFLVVFFCIYALSVSSIVLFIFLFFHYSFLLSFVHDCVWPKCNALEEAEKKREKTSVCKRFDVKIRTQTWWIYFVEIKIINTVRSKVNQMFFIDILIMMIELFFFGLLSLSLSLIHSILSILILN